MMKKTAAIIALILPILFVLLGCDDDNSNDHNYQADAGAPYIYLYPEKSQEVSVTLIPTEGAWIMNSDPEYGDGWTVWAETDGRLDEKYDFLFYSARVFWDFQMELGWAVEPDKVFPWFMNTLPTLGLSQTETDDFVTYWSVHLPYSPCYLIYPQFDEPVDRQIELFIDPEPESRLRLWLAIDRSESCKKIPAPEPVVFNRIGFTVVEWGVVMREQLADFL
jgi:hypothetical protein